LVIIMNVNIEFYKKEISINKYIGFLAPFATSR
jgi:hypothetical protein